MPDREILDLICAAEREAAALILRAHGILAECKSGRRDVVTEYDRRVQALLVERLSAAVPDAQPRRTRRITSSVLSPFPRPPFTAA